MKTKHDNVTPETLRIGAALKKRRCELRLKQDDVASDAHISAEQYRRIEKGKPTSLVTLTSICRVLHFSMDVLLGTQSQDEVIQELIRELSLRTAVEKEYICRMAEITLAFLAELQRSGQYVPVRSKVSPTRSREETPDLRDLPEHSPAASYHTFRYQEGENAVSDGSARVAEEPSSYGSRSVK